MIRIKCIFSASVALGLLLASSALSQQIKLNPGVTPGKQVHIDKARDYAFCEIVPITGQPPEVVAQFYNSTGASDCPASAFNAIDPKKLAEKLGANMVWMNPARHWTFDELWVFKAGETFDFDGVKATFMATMPANLLNSGTKGPYSPMQIHRDTMFSFQSGKPVFLMRLPDGKVYVMQAYGREVDNTMTMDKLAELGTRLKLPEGWKFEVAMLKKDLEVDPRKADGVAHIIQDGLKNTYEGCGFDDACNYVP
jgi:hypothetical protein